MDNDILEGKIKVFEPGKNYGFIETGNKDIFFHLSALQGNVDKGDRVQFRIGSFHNRSCAIEIQKL